MLARVGAVLTLHATPGGRTETLVREAVTAGKPVAALDHSTNAHLVALGATPVTAATVVAWHAALMTADPAGSGGAGIESP